MSRTGERTSGMSFGVRAVVALAAAGATLVAAGCSSGKSTGNAAPAIHYVLPDGGGEVYPTAGTSSMSPSAARLAIAGGMGCSVSEVGRNKYTDRTYKFWDGATHEELTDVPVTLRFKQTAASRDARAQYEHSNAVMWQTETIGAEPYRDHDGTYTKDGHNMSEVIAGETTQGNVDALVPTEDVKAGDVFSIESEQSVQTESGESLRETDSTVPCGAIADIHGTWEAVPYRSPATIHTFRPKPAPSPVPTPEPAPTAESSVAAA